MRRKRSNRYIEHAKHHLATWFAVIGCLGSLGFAHAEPLAHIVQVAAGGQHKCALIADGTVYCWGSNSVGQLGNGGVADSPVPVKVSGISNAVGISASPRSSHTCAVLASGDVRCWGAGNVGQLGNGVAANSNVPVMVSGISGAISVVAGSEYSCASMADGTAKCWGGDFNGELGDGGGGSDANSLVPKTVAGLSEVTKLTAGFTHACAIMRDGTLTCWGDNYYGALGAGVGMSYVLPTKVNGLTGVVAAAAGNMFTCVVLNDGSVSCLGDGYGSTPKKVDGLTGVTAIGAADNYCVLFSDDRIGCRGDGTNNSSTSLLVFLEGATTATSLSVGDYGGCAVLRDTSAKCWGNNGAGEIGNGLVYFSPMPKRVVAVRNALSIAAGGSESLTQLGASEHSCATLVDGSVQCWGSNVFGVVGDGEFSYAAVSTPVPVVGINNASQVAAGYAQTCALMRTGDAKCWGQGQEGEIGGSPPISYSPTPVAVSGVSNAKSIAAGGFHNCALIADGSVKCWGNNVVGELGDGTFTSAYTAVSVAGITSATTLGLGWGHSCASLASGAVRCWGKNDYGQLGNGGDSVANSPVNVVGITNAISVTASADHSCALLADGSVACWGENTYGELGDGSSTDRSTPVMVRGLTGATGVAAGAHHTCALLGTGQVQCWGKNLQGELGNGVFVMSRTPVDVILSGATAIAAGSAHTCVLLNDGSARCWGSDKFSALGDGFQGNYGVPQTVVSPAQSFSGVNLDQRGLGGVWYDPANSGSGFLLDVFPDFGGPGQGLLAASWYTFNFGVPETQAWYTLQGSASSGSQWASLGIYSTRGGNFNAGPRVASTQVGIATLTFTDCNTASLDYVFTDGSYRRGSIPLTRGLANLTCSPFGDNGAVSDNLLSGVWYDPATSGQGFFVEINPNQSTFFAGWYTYPPAGPQTGVPLQTWYTLQDNTFAAGTRSKSAVPIYQTSGGSLQNFDFPHDIVTTKVGTVNLSFLSCTSLKIDYAFVGGINAGLNGTINLVRLGPTPAGCTF